MDTVTLDALAVTRTRRARFIACVFCGSFLLFLVQPLVARMALPRLGGAPSVWNSAMLVYQGLLLAGYAYAHFLGRLAPRRQALVHLALFGLAALTLPIALIAATPPPDGNIFIWVPWLLVVSIGPLFIVVSAQAPLMQRWFSLAGADDPYPLYAASNLGSFLGLIAYPLLVEPMLPTAAQSLVWSLGYGALAVLIVACALALPRQGLAPIDRIATERPPTREIVRWITFSAIPSGLMLSTTLHLTTDIVAMPLLWVVPLGLYLLSFTVAFAADRRASLILSRAAPVLLLVAAYSVCADVSLAPWLTAGAALLALFVVAVAIHSRLFDSRPDPSHLTVFYFCTSIGGALGGLFCALIAPLIFDWTYEYPLLVAAAGFALVGRNPFTRLAALWNGSVRARRVSRWLGIAAVYLSLAGIGWFGMPTDLWLSLAASVAIFAIGIVAIGNRPLFVTALAALMLCIGGWAKLGLSMSGLMERSFFGIYSVQEIPGEARMLVHGTTSHGVELLGSPERERMLTNYYAPRSGVALALNGAAPLFPNARVDIVGLGAGTLACASRPGQGWRFYEIDPKVVAIARDPAHFRFLAHCQPKADVVVGDARLMLERQPARDADIVVVDAFSSDSVPMHLLTLEAFEVYRRRLVPDGLLLVHISNRYLDLRPVVAAAAASGWTARIRTYFPTAAEREEFAGASMWVIMSRDPATIAAVERSSGPDGWKPLPAPTSAPWTDDHASILPLIKWGR